MALPALPEGYQWRVGRGYNATTLSVGIWPEDEPLYPIRSEALMEGRAHFGSRWGADDIIAGVEQAAADVLERFNRDRFVATVVQANWPDER